MIFRRIKAHIEKENWFAVFVDFCIVVGGVFIGLQVANWNEARAFKAQENAYLSQLRSEIRLNLKTIDYQERFVEQVVISGRRILSFVESERDCTDRCELALIDAFHASQVWGTGYSRTKFDEMNRLGLPTDETTRTSVHEFFQFIDGWDVVNATPPEYRERVRGALSPDQAVVLWRGCYRITDGSFEELTNNCQEELKALNTLPALERIRKDNDIAAMLRFWVGQNEYALQFYPDMRHRAEAAISAIDQVLGES